jgi:2-polyprenyl-3-methyl-5-hydroxy-6-metoxy-1,4-benzoquinol methylase
MSKNIDLRLRLPKENLDKMRVLNVGIGSGRSGIARQLPLLAFKRLDHIEVNKPYIEGAVKLDWASKEVGFILADIRNVENFDYDMVLMFDVLEHLPKEDSLKILDRIKCAQVIFIPLEKEFRANVFSAESQDHLSLWTEEDFKSRGYRTEALKDFHKVDGRVFDALWAIK